MGHQDERPVEQSWALFSWSAGARLMKVLTQANRQSGGDWPRKRVYLYGYFFEEFLGLGLPADYAVQSAFNSFAVSLPVSGGGKGDLGPAMSGAAISGLGALGDYSSMGGSSSGGMDMSALMAALQKSIADGLAPLREGKTSADGGGGGGGDSNTPRSCVFCGRKGCQMLSGGYPCHEANRARKLLKSEKDGGSKKGGGPKGGASDEDASK